MTPAHPVLAQELRLLEAGVRADPDQVLTLLHPDFVEFGSSGRIWTRDTVAGSLDAQSIAAHDLTARELADGAVLVTYVSERDGHRALRSSLWVRSGSSWLMVFHQGTPAA